MKPMQPPLPLQLPQPAADALSASQALQQLIADDIGRAGGWISFARYMELALYAPGLGYYSGGAVKLGKDGDFTTAPETTPLFGAALAHAAAPLLQQCAPQMLEFGAGSGRLARDILTELAQIGAPLQRYYIVELSGELRARQEQMLRGFAQVQWLEQLPAAFSGVALGNEVLDAMPVQLVTKSADGWQERGVGLGPGPNPGPDGTHHFIYVDRACAPALIAQIPGAEALPLGYLTEVHPVASGFMRSLAAMLEAGATENDGRGSAALLIDYGFPAHEYYFHEREQGTLMCHYRHHAHGEAFFLPGLQDLTAHVDFTQMARVAQDSGLDVLGYTSQAAFLMVAGIGDLLLRTDPANARQYLPQASAVQKLLSPAEMGELFKVLVVGKQVQLPPQFERHDRSHRL
jgi:SAM-dependent MidA family methyltransferase